MTNREKYAKEMLGMLGYGIAVNRKTGKPAICERTKCLDCLLYGEQDCSKLFRNWLEAEYTEPVKTVKASELAVDTKVICWIGDKECGVNRYFAKIKNGKLYAYRDGATSWSSGSDKEISWKNMALEDGTIVLAE